MSIMIVPVAVTVLRLHSVWKCGAGASSNAAPSGPLCPQARSPPLGAVLSRPHRPPYASAASSVSPDTLALCALAHPALVMPMIGRPPTGTAICGSSCPTAALGQLGRLKHHRPTHVKVRFCHGRCSCLPVGHCAASGRSRYSLQGCGSLRYSMSRSGI